MAAQMLIGTIYSKFDVKLGGIPIYWIPRSTISKDILEKIAEDSLNLYIGIIKEDPVPEKLSIIHFSPFNLTGLVKMIRYSDPNIRGGVSETTLSIIYNEKDDAIFYKYIDDFQFLFDEVAKDIFDLERQKKPRKAIEEKIQDFDTKVREFLDDLRAREMEVTSTEAFADNSNETDQGDAKKLLKAKLIVSGDPNVGKTSLILRYTNNAFSRTYLPTMGVNLSEKTITIDDFKIIFNIWDLAGQVKFSPLMKQFYTGSNAQIIVFDLTRPATKRNASKWYKDIQKHVGHAPVGILVGNKSDLGDLREVSKEEALQLQEDLGLELIETSALTGDKVEAAFVKLGKILIEEFEKRQ